MKKEAKPRLDSHPGEGALRSTTRMEAFADAVFAIAFTLPIVELKIPSPGPGFGVQLVALWPSYLSFLLAALVIGIYWTHHHFGGAIFRTAGHHFLLATLMFLAAVSFVAYPTRAFAEHLPDADARAAGGLFYSLALSITAVTWWIKWRVGLNRGDVDERLDPLYVRRLCRGYDKTTAIMVAAIPIAFVSWEAGLLVTGSTTLWYLRAPETPVYRGASPSSEDAG